MEKGALHVIVEHLALALRPLRAAGEDLESFQALMRRLGWDVASLPTTFQELVTAVGELMETLEKLPDGAALDEVIDLLRDVKAIFTAVKNLQDAPIGVDFDAFTEEIPERLFELLVTEYLGEAFPTVSGVLEVLRVLEDEYVPGSEPDVFPVRLAYVRRKLDPAPLGRLFSDPTTLPSVLYRWGDPEFEFDRLAGHVFGLANAFDLPARLGSTDPELLSAYAAQPADRRRPSTTVTFPLVGGWIDESWYEVGLTLLGVPAEGEEAPGLALQVEIPSEIEVELEMGEGLFFKLGVEVEGDLALGLRLRPDSIEPVYPFSPEEELPEAGFDASLEFKPAAPRILLGRPAASRLEIRETSASLEVRSDAGDVELRMGFAADYLKVILAFGDQDSFLGSLFGGQDLVLDLPLALEWSNRTGLRFAASPGFELSAHPHLDLGPITIETLRFGIRVHAEEGEPADLMVTVAVSLSGELGPVSFAIEEMGLVLEMRFEEGNAGPFDLAVDLQYPSGMAVGIDASPVVGVGALYLDHERGRYAGFLQLEVFDIGIVAVGLVETKVPGVDYSFVVMVGAKFPPIQLGFGVTANGLGLLVAIHRTVVTDEIQRRMRDGTIDYLLFPEDPARDFPEILATLEVVFPVKKDRYAFGIAFILGWGTPTIVEAQVAVIIEVPKPVRLVLLGQLRMALPDPDVPFVLIQVDILGVIDFETPSFSIDAMLRDSKVAGCVIRGDLALRFIGGSRPNAVISVGGTHPHFPMPLLPSDMVRITVHRGVGNFFRITFYGYVCLWSNGFAFGARVELWAGAAGCSLEGWAGIDAVVQFSPFFFRADLDAGVALKLFGKKIASIQIEALLMGPHPFRARGEACVSLLFFDACVGFDVSFGPDRRNELPGRDPWPELLAALENPDSWEVTFPTGFQPALSWETPVDVTLFAPPTAGTTCRQKVAPFHRRLTKFGEFQPEGSYRFDVTSVTVGQKDLADEEWSMVQDLYPPSFCEKLSNHEKLSRASFERMDLAIAVANETTRSGEQRTLEVSYETKIVESPWSSRDGGSRTLGRAAQRALDRHAAATQAYHRNTAQARFASDPAAEAVFDVGDQEFVVASTTDLSERTEFGKGMPEGEATLALEEYLAEHPQERGSLQVIPRFEAAA